MITKIIINSQLWFQRWVKYNKKCYLLIKEKQTWENARKKCNFTSVSVISANSTTYFLPYLLDQRSTIVHLLYQIFGPYKNRMGCVINTISAKVTHPIPTPTQHLCLHHQEMFTPPSITINTSSALQSRKKRCRNSDQLANYRRPGNN